jgi:hypothetical protein
MKRNRGELIVGLVLILLGVWFVAQRQFPDFQKWVEMYAQGPMALVVGGGVLFVLGLVLGAPGMSIPAAIVAGIGGILYYQEMVKDPTIWSYMWTLIIGFVGVGNVLAGLIGRNSSQVNSGLNTIVVSAVMFIVFAAAMGKLAILGAYGPAILLILLGLYVMLRGFFRKGG